MTAHIGGDASAALHRLPGVDTTIARPDERQPTPRAVLINGTVGVGKSTVAEELGTLLTQVHIPNAVIDVDCLRNSWPRPAGDRFNMRLALRNLTSLTRNFVEAGMTRLIVAGVVETPSDRQAYENALGIPLTLCRLRADLDVVRDRLILRHGAAGETLEWHIRRAPQLDAILDSTAVDDHAFDVSNATATDAASEILRALGWHTGESATT